jgi:hypothetical protein
MNQLDLFAPERIRWFYVDCRDERGNARCHRVADPEATIRYVEARLPGVKAEVRR